MDLYYGVAQLQRNIVIVQTLLNISCKTAGVGHQFANCVYLGALQGHSSCHDQTDVTGTQDNDFFAGQIAHLVYVLLGSTCTENTCRTAACNIQSAFGTLSAAHSQHDSLSLDLENAVFLVGSGDHLVFCDIQNHGAQLVRNTKLAYLLFVSPCILGTGQLFAELVEAETIVDTLLEDAAKRFVSLQDQNVADTIFVCFYSSTHACRAAADNY